MKTKYFYNLLFFPLLLVIVIPLYGQKSIDKVVRKERQINPGARVTISNKFADLTILSSKKDIAILETSLTVTTKSEKDTEKILEALEEIDFEGDASNIRLDLILFKNSVNIMGSKRLTLVNGNVIRFSEYKISHILYLPEQVNLNIDNKYGEIVIPAIIGWLQLNTYDGDTRAGNISGQVEIESKYSEIEIGTSEKLNLNLYDSEIEAGKTGDMTINTKYSDVDISEAGTTVISSYDDKINIKISTSVELNAKYTDYIFEKNHAMKMDLYDCNITGGSATELYVESKYSTVDIDRANKISLTSSYDDEFKLKELYVLVSHESKYTDYELDKLNQEMVLKGYDDNVIISKLDKEFTGLEFAGKYGDFTVSIDQSAAFNFIAELKYPHLDLPDDMKIRIKIKENSSLQMEASYGNVSEQSPVIMITGYEQSLNIR
jgi:hypothetical protein